MVFDFPYSKFGAGGYIGNTYAMYICHIIKDTSRTKVPPVFGLAWRVRRGPGQPNTTSDKLPGAVIAELSVTQTCG